MTDYQPTLTGNQIKSKLYIFPFSSQVSSFSATEMPTGATFNANILGIKAFNNLC